MEGQEKRVERIWRREGLKVPVGSRAGSAVVQRRLLRAIRPGYPNHVWAYDFVADQTYDGKAYGCGR